MTNQIEISASCTDCAIEKKFTVPEAAYRAWKNGGLIQNCLTMVPADDREIFISGLCSKCFDALFEGMEDQE